MNVNGGSDSDTICFHSSLASQEKHGADRFHSLIFRPGPKWLLERRHLDIYKPSGLKALLQERASHGHTPSLAECLTQHGMVFLEAFPHGVVVGKHV